MKVKHLTKNKKLACTQRTAAAGRPNTEPNIFDRRECLRVFGEGGGMEVHAACEEWQRLELAVDSSAAESICLMP